MNKKAIIYDFDNTIYSVKSIGEELFTPLFELICSTGQHDENMGEIKNDLMAKPFQVVAREYNFSEELIQQCTELLRRLTYKGEIRPFEDYEEIGKIPGERYLVTTGFTDLQWSKIRKIGIEADFQEIHVVDPDISQRTKKDVFKEILERKGYTPDEVLVVGDDPDSEIKAARELGIATVLLDKFHQHRQINPNEKVTDFKELKERMTSTNRQR